MPLAASRRRVGDRHRVALSDARRDGMTTRTSSAVLVTGATGLVGNELIDQLLNDTTIEVVGVSRRGSRANPEIAAWDMATEPPPAILRRRWGAIVNTAANTRWTMSPEEDNAANVASVRG